MATVRVGWLCGYSVGAPRWYGTEILLSDECDADFETEEDFQDWKEMLCTAECPQCHATLDQIFDEPYLIVEAE